MMICVARALSRNRMVELWFNTLGRCPPATVLAKKQKSLPLPKAAMTCGYKFDISKGRLMVPWWRVFDEQFNYDRVQNKPIWPALVTMCTWKGTDTGFRIRRGL